MLSHKKQTREVFDLLAKLGTVKQLTIRGSWGKQTAPLDDEETAPITNLRQLKHLGLQGCSLPGRRLEAAGRLDPTQRFRPRTRDHQRRKTA